MQGILIGGYDLGASSSLFPGSGHSLNHVFKKAFALESGERSCALACNNDTERNRLVGIIRIMDTGRYLKEKVKQQWKPTAWDIPNWNGTVGDKVIVTSQIDYENTSWVGNKLPE